MPKDTFYRLSNLKQNAVLNAAIKEFSEREVKDAKVSNIIKDSKISRGSFYQYFINIEDLYHYVISYIRKIQIDYFQDFFLREDFTFIERIRELYKKSVDFSNNNKLFIKIGKKHLDSAYLDSDHGYQKTVDDMEVVLIRWIQIDINKGLLRKDINQKVLADMTITFLNLFLTEHIYYKIMSKDELNQKIESIINILENGVLCHV